MDGLASKGWIARCFGLVLTSWFQVWIWWRGPASKGWVIGGFAFICTRGGLWTAGCLDAAGMASVLNSGLEISFLFMDCMQNCMQHLFISLKQFRRAFLAFCSWKCILVHNLHAYLYQEIKKLEKSAVVLMSRSHRQQATLYKACFTLAHTVQAYGRLLWVKHVYAQANQLFQMNGWKCTYQEACDRRDGQIPFCGLPRMLSAPWQASMVLQIYHLSILFLRICRFGYRRSDAKKLPNIRI